jgi:PAS domain S-box-containing protein
MVAAGKDAVVPMTELKASLEDYLDIADVMLIVLGADRKVKVMNRKGLEILGCEKEDVLGKDWFDTFVPKRDRAATVEGFKMLMTGKDAPMARYQNAVLTKHGEERLISWHNKTLLDKDGKITGTLSSGEDITERDELVKGGLRATRALRTLSSANQVLIRAQAVKELLDKVCKVIVQEGGYPMAWVGVADETGHVKHVRPVTVAGDQTGYLEEVHITLEGDGPKGKGPMAMAFRSGRTVMLKFMKTSLDQLPWRQKALDSGYKSVISLPLKNHGGVVGALNIYSETEDAFDDNERVLLEEMADDMSFGMNTINARHEKMKALTEKTESDRRLATLMGNIPGMAYRCKNNQDRRMEFVSDGCRALTGYEPKEIMQGGKITFGHDIVHPDERGRVWLMIQQCMDEGQSFKMIYKLIRKDGAVRWVMEQGRGVHDNRGKLSIIEGYMVDITDQMSAQEALRRRSRDEIFLFLASAIPAFASNITTEVRDILIRNFSKRFEDNVKPRFMKDMAERNGANGLHGTAKVDMPSYIDWLSDFFTNIGIRTRIDTSDGTTTLEILQCPWTEYATGNPIFCQICRAMIIRSFTWTGLTGQVEQRSSKAGGGEECMFCIKQ